VRDVFKKNKWYHPDDSIILQQKMRRLNVVTFIISQIIITTLLSNQMITINGKENVIIQPDDNICYLPAELHYSSSQT
jgi:hypothetical protein